MKHSYFKDWIKSYPAVIHICMYFILLSGLVPFGVFSLTSVHALSAAGAQPEDMSFALLVTYVGILVTLPVQFRFLRYFETRNYLVFNIIAAIALSFICIIVSDMVIFTIVRFFQGIVICNIAGCMLVIMFSILKTEKALVIGSSFFYTCILSSAALVGLAVSVIVTSYSWKTIYIYLIVYQLLTIIVSLLIFKSRTGHKRYPLYQIDWLGSVLFITAGITMAYTMIYGPKYYWFDDSRIVFSAVASISLLGAFMLRLSYAKRPLVNLDVFKNRNFIIGLILLAFYYGVKDSINLIYGYTAVVLKWSTTDTVLLALCSVAGMVTAMAVTAQLLLKYRNRITYFFTAGFSFMLFYHLYIFYILTPDLAFSDLILPVFMQGAASGTLMVPIVIFILSSAPAYTGTTGVVVAAYTRFTATLNSIAGFYSLQLYYNQSHRQGLLNGLSVEDNMIIQQLSDYGGSASTAYSSLNRLLLVQVQLLTIRSLFLWISAVLVLTILLILLIPSLNKTILHWNKGMFILRRK